jgi:hypothetical protein
LTREFRTFYIATGRPITRPSFADDTRSLLKKQYIRVAKAFSNEMRLAENPEKSFLSTKQEGEDEEFTEIVDAALLLYINQQLPGRSAALDQTTVNDMNSSIQEAQTTLAEEGSAITNLSVGTLASKNLNRKFAGRVTTINMTETQFMAESTKAIEAVVVDSEGDVDIANILGAAAVALLAAKKSWASILDGKTRRGEFDHVRADGQKVKIGQPFTVSGEKLKFPSDSSLGASIGNTAGCRCSALYSLL